VTAVYLPNAQNQNDCSVNYFALFYKLCLLFDLEEQSPESGNSF